MRMSINGYEPVNSKCAAAIELEGMGFWFCSDFGTKITNFDFTAAL